MLLNRPAVPQGEENTGEEVDEAGARPGESQYLQS